VGHQARARAAHLFDGQFYPEVVAEVAVVYGRHRPRHLGAVSVVCRMVIAAVVSQFFHNRGPVTVDYWR
jgi:hypothetical protein